MDQRIVLGMGTGRCGNHALAQFLNQQPDFDVTHEEWPLLPWTSKVAADLIRERFVRIRRKRTAREIGDVAPFYLRVPDRLLVPESDGALRPGIAAALHGLAREAIAGRSARSALRWFEQRVALLPTP